MLIEETLSWNENVEKLSTKIAPGIGALKRIRPFAPSSTLQFIYNSLIQPHFDYCSVVCGNCVKTLGAKLQQLQSRPARVLIHQVMVLVLTISFNVLAEKNWIANERFRKLLWSINHSTVLPQIISVLRLQTVAAYQPIH